MLRLLSAMKRRLSHERGQALVLGMLLIGVLAGGAAIAVDVGSYMSHRRSLQNYADAIALAASQELPVGESAHSAANEWASNNGVNNDDMTVTVTQQSASEPNPKVEVELEEEHSMTFLRVLGIGSADVGATATAIITSPSGGDSISPLSVEEEALLGATLGDEVVLKYDANDISQGNTSPIRVDGPGSGNCSSTDNYCSALQYGSNNVICADGSDPSSCDGASVVETEPGNKVGGTRTALDWRINNTDPECSNFEGANGVFEDDPTTNEPGVYHIRPDCNPFTAGGYASHRVLVVPVIDSLCSGSCEVTIVSFALFYLERIGDGGCTGNDCEVVGRFVKVNQNVGMLAGTYDEDSFQKFVRLVQ